MPWIKAKKEFVAAVKQALGRKTELSYGDLEVPPNPAMGDLCLPVFSLAKEMKKPPAQVASELALALAERTGGLFASFKANGPYLNAFLNKEAFAALVMAEMASKKKKYGFAPGRGKKILVEFVSPNTNKPLHLGHLRNGFLGHSLCEILLKQSNKVVRSILYNDRGAHIMKSMLAYARYGVGDSPKKSSIKGDHFVGKYYVLFGEKAKKDPSLEEEAQKWLLRWERGDKKLMALWKKMNNWAESGFRETLERLGIYFSREERESRLYKKGKKIIFAALKKGLLFKDENGNIAARLEQWKMPDKVLLRSDGTAVYATTDIALAVSRWEKHKFDELIYVVGMEQDLHFKQLFKIFEILGFPFASRCRHLSYNWVYLPEGRMKSREGRVVDADALLDELQELALEEIRKRNDGLAREGDEARAEQIAQAALKFYLLEVDPGSDIHFNPSSAIALTGRTGPYIQYSYARISSILRKAGSKNKFTCSKLGKLEITGAEYRLFLLLGKYGSVIESGERGLNPAGVAKYLYELAKAFSDFYETEPVLKAPPAAREKRLCLISRVRDVLASGLALLGISALEEM
ncbi:arginine--tRNA ligase [Candidatus Uhrbacteria bacterium]|nr:arginine--tRNA ligase [Candidatus Uhrbacteria bacterium]